MKDRVGTLVLANGARRYARYDENGTLLGYEYLLLADEPTEAGTVLNKATLLSDSTAAAIGLTGDPTVNDALAKLVHTTEITLANTGWTSSAPYKKSVNVSGMTAGMNIEYALSPSATTAAQYESFGYISTVETLDGAIRFTCMSDKPTVNIPIVLKGV